MLPWANPFLAAPIQRHDGVAEHPVLAAHHARRGSRNALRDAHPARRRRCHPRSQIPERGPCAGHSRDHSARTSS